MSDGLLEMGIVKDFSRWRVAYMLPLLLVGKAQWVGYLSVKAIDHCKLTTELSSSIQIDGDPGEASKVVEVDILPQQLQVIVPQMPYTLKAEMMDRSRKLWTRKKQ